MVKKSELNEDPPGLGGLGGLRRKSSQDTIMDLMDEKLTYYSPKIKPGSHTDARARKYRREQH